MAKEAKPQDSFWRENWSVVFFMITVAIAIIGALGVAVFRFFRA